MLYRLKYSRQEGRSIFKSRSNENDITGDGFYWIGKILIIVINA